MAGLGGEAGLEERDGKLKFLTAIPKRLDIMATRQQKEFKAFTDACRTTIESFEVRLKELQRFKHDPEVLVRRAQAHVPGFSTRTSDARISPRGPSSLESSSAKLGCSVSAAASDAPRLLEMSASFRDRRDAA
jgi:hypothetical protein